jgi:hypothetical protein
MKAILIYLNIYVGSPEKKTWPNVLSIWAFPPSHPGDVLSKNNTHALTWFSHWQDTPNKIKYPWKHF